MAVTPTPRTAFRLPPDLVGRLRARAKERGVTLSALVETTLQQSLDGPPPPPTQPGPVEPPRPPRPRAVSNRPVTRNVLPNFKTPKK